MLFLDLPENSKLALIFNGDLNINPKAQSIKKLIGNSLGLVSLKPFN